MYSRRLIEFEVTLQERDSTAKPESSDRENSHYFRFKTYTNLRFPYNSVKGQGCSESAHLGYTVPFNKEVLLRSDFHVPHLEIE